LTHFSRWLSIMPPSTTDLWPTSWKIVQIVQRSLPSLLQVHVDVH